jgi:hypothetical protein
MSLYITNMKNGTLVPVLRVRTSVILSVVKKSMDRTYKVCCSMRIRTFEKIVEKRMIILFFDYELITARGTELSALLKTKLYHPVKMQRFQYNITKTKR